MITASAGPALAAGGSSYIVKPGSPETPFSALAMAALAEAGRFLEAWWFFNVITGDAIAIGAELTGKPVGAQLSFTGSTRDWQVVDGAVRADAEESVAGTGRGNARSLSSTLPTLSVR